LWEQRVAGSNPVSPTIHPSFGIGPAHEHRVELAFAPAIRSESTLDGRRIIWTARGGEAARLPVDADIAGDPVYANLRRVEEAHRCVARYFFLANFQFFDLEPTVLAATNGGQHRPGHPDFSSAIDDLDIDLIFKANI